MGTLLGHYQDQRMRNHHHERMLAQMLQTLPNLSWWKLLAIINNRVLRLPQKCIHPSVFFIHPSVCFYCPGSLLAVKWKQTPRWIKTNTWMNKVLESRNTLLLRKFMAQFVVVCIYLYIYIFFNLPFTIVFGK